MSAFMYTCYVSCIIYVAIGCRLISSLQKSYDKEFNVWIKLLYSTLFMFKESVNEIIVAVLSHHSLCECLLCVRSSGVEYITYFIITDPGMQYVWVKVSVIYLFSFIRILPKCVQLVFIPNRPFYANHLVPLYSTYVVSTPLAPFTNMV